MQLLTVENVLAAILIMWLFNLLTFVRQSVKDATNAVVIVLAIILWCFGLGAKL